MYGGVAGVRQSPGMETACRPGQIRMEAVYHTEVDVDVYWELLPVWC